MNILLMVYGYVKGAHPSASIVRAYRGGDARICVSQMGRDGMNAIMANFVSSRYEWANYASWSRR